MRRSSRASQRIGLLGTSAGVADADVDAAALHVSGKRQEGVLLLNLVTSRSSSIWAAAVTAAAAATSTAASTAASTGIAAAASASAAASLAAQRLCHRPVCLSKDAGQAVVALPRGAAEHECVAAAQQQRRGRVVPAGCSHQEDGVAAQAEADQRLGQAALSIVYVPVQGVACAQGRVG